MLDVDLHPAHSICNVVPFPSSSGKVLRPAYIIFFVIETCVYAHSQSSRKNLNRAQANRDIEKDKAAKLGVK